MSLDIPGHEHFVSSVSLTEGTLSLRIATDAHPGLEASAYELRAYGIKNPEEAVAFLNARKVHREYIYVCEKDKSVVVATENGSEITLSATEFSGSVERLNAEELAVAFARVYAWYESEYAANVAAQDRLRRIREQLVEQARRIEAKAQSHHPASAAGVLYGQQLTFIERLLRESET